MLHTYFLQLQSFLSPNAISDNVPGVSEARRRRVWAERSEARYALLGGGNYYQKLPLSPSGTWIS
jgi:hypothetical protein